MPFRYDNVTGPIHPQGDSEAVQGYKAGAGAFRYALKRAGWSDEQIDNGLQSHFESIALVLSEHILDKFIQDRRGVGTVSAWTVAQEVVAEIHPKSSPCGRSYCTTCQPGRKRT